jgi:hypothetical protein
MDPGDYTGALPSISNSFVPGEIMRLIPGDRYGNVHMMGIALQRFRSRFGLYSPPILTLGVGWPGTSSEKFLPDGSSYNYTDDDGNPQTTTAVVHPDAGVYLWDRAISRRTAVETFIADRWPGRTLRWPHLSWIQGPFDDYGNAYGFMEEYRAQQDLLSVGVRDIYWDQDGGRTNSATRPRGAQAQLEFCQDNASGHDWLVGPRYPHALYDTIHHSSFGALEYAERAAQAAAYVEAFGEWEPVWITEVNFSGADAILTINRPRQCPYDLEVDTTAVPAATNHGFALHNGTSPITISSVTVGADTITITAAAPLSGTVEVCYSTRAASTRPGPGTPEAPVWAATAGNIKRPGRDAPAIIPTAVQPVLDQWLCAYRKTFTV